MMFQGVSTNNPQELSRIRDLLDQQDWNDLLPRLVRISLYLLRKSRGNATLEKTFAGKTAEDYAMDAVMKLYSGERRWDPNNYPDLFFYLIGILRSLISHEFERRMNRDLVFVEVLPQDGHPTDSSAWVDMAETDGFKIDDLKNFVKDDPGLSDFVTYLAQGERPAAIALRMGLLPDQIYNLRKVLKRRFVEFFRQHRTRNE